MTAEELVTERRESSPFLRLIADLLTLTRFLIAAFIVGIGLFVGPQALGAAIIATMFGWVTDIMDGPLARSSGCGESWVSRLDFIADVTMGYSFFLFLVTTGLFPVLPALLLVVAAVTVVIIRPTEAVIQIVTAPIFALPVVLAFQVGIVVGACYAAFLLTLAVFRWDHLVADARRAHAEAGGNG
ncbi:MAG: hypothetical protein KKB90_12935 [Actinobacteria bacterium]|nr:hypothetical protein [Actinomycetota bacterium]MCG2820185.1 hypothetical protein [Actinomycetes bacterium]MBU4179574.1 hypothetical protein [Actinomycetota bacterium]MBU4219843.1 hypothetical protein [Actinomycetota bacterium]MBU4357737.1 hypothetical protein [Actinomycetota bacterium]